MNLPPNACIFTYDAISMYTNIETKDCINRISEFLLNPTTLAAYPYLNPPITLEALSLVMLNNRMRFNDIIPEQHGLMSNS